MSMINPYSAVIQEATRLYRRIFRVHRNLPLEMRLLGDSHVRHEWREMFIKQPRGGGQHSPEIVATFLSQWRTYAEALEQGELGGMREGLAHLNDDQVDKMGQLKDAAANVHHGDNGQK